MLRSCEDPLDTEAPALTAEALDDIGRERERQFQKWGPQHHPDGTGVDTIDGFSDRAFGEMRDYFREACDEAAKFGGLTWRHILLEEVFEALAESEPDALRKELIQSAAVATAWVEDIDSRVD